MSGKQTALKAAYFSIAGNLGLALLKGFAGFLGNSFALIADAIESTSDFFSSLLVLLGLKYSQRDADDNHPYGHGRIEPLVTFFIVAFLVVSAAIIGWESIQNIRTPHAMPAPWTLWVLGFIILWKELSYRFVNRKSEQTNSSSLKADARHHRADAITSVAAFVGISAALILGEGYEAADDWAALLACGVILYNCYRIFRPALGELMDEQLYDELVEEVRRVSMTVKGVLGTEKCYVRKSGMSFYVDLHAIVDGNISVSDGHRLAHVLADTLKEEIPNIENVLVHVEPDESEEVRDRPVEKKMTMRYFIEHVYDGTAYCGWQIQKNGITVQQVIEEKLSVFLKTPVRLIGSSRTDTGVHACQQFAHFDLERSIEDTQQLVFQLNATLPFDVAVVEIRPVSETVHSRFDASYRRYCYKMVRRKDPFMINKAYYFRKELDKDKMNLAAAHLIGHRDFESFSKIHTDVNHFECHISSAYWETGGDHLWQFHIQSNRFLRGMVRAIVGTLLEVGEGKRSVQSFEELIVAKNRKMAGPQAPPHGLYLMEVGYPPEIFSYKSE